MVLVGERAAGTPGLLTAVGDLVGRHRRRLAWVPRRAGERGALDAGALRHAAARRPPVADPAARAEVEKVWGASLPTTPGRDTAGILAAVGDRRVSDDAGDRRGPGGPRGLAGLLIGGVEISDLPDPAAALAAVASAGFVVSLESRVSAVTELADVVFPVAAAAEKSGAYVNWEGRVRPFAAALPEAGTLDEAPDPGHPRCRDGRRPLHPDPGGGAAEIARLGSGPAGRARDRTARPVGPGAARPVTGFLLASWRMNLDGGRADGR